MDHLFLFRIQMNPSSYSVVYLFTLSRLLGQRDLWSNLWNHSIVFMEQYQRQHSLWNLIKQYVPDSELAEVRSLIGEALIDVYTDLYSEVSCSLMLQ